MIVEHNWCTDKTRQVFARMIEPIDDIRPVCGNPPRPVVPYIARPQIVGVELRLGSLIYYSLRERTAGSIFL